MTAQPSAQPVAKASGDSAAPPLYASAARAILRDIMAGRIADGARLPPEREMAASMGIAVGTLRRALAELAAQGLVERRHGSGNYVRAGSDVAGVYSLFRLERPEGGGVPGAEVLACTRRPKPAGAPAFGPSAEAHRLRRLRLLDGEPAALEEIWFDAGRVADLAPVLDGPLYHGLRARLGLWIAAAEDRVGLGQVPGWAPERFAPAAGAPCPLVERVGRAQDGAAVEYSRTWIDARRAVYVARLC